MKRKKIRVGYAACALTVVVLLAVCQLLFEYPIVTMKAVDEGTMELHALDVGQADCTLIRTEAGYVLVDTGEAVTARRVVAYLRRAGVDRLAYLVLTHPDSDHIGGAPAVLAAIPTDAVILPRLHESDRPQTEVYLALEEALATSCARVIEATAGDIMRVGALQLTILAPLHDDYEDINDYSVVVRMDFGETSFLFTGDATAPVEAELLEKYTDELLRSTLFQAGHHGANTSNTKDFVAAVAPEIVVVSCGANAFGHPSGEALVSYALAGATVYKTGEEGTIVFVSDGTEIRKK